MLYGFDFNVKKEPSHTPKSVGVLSIPAAGVEPARPCGHRILSMMTAICDIQMLLYQHVRTTETT